MHSHAEYTRKWRKTEKGKAGIERSKWKAENYTIMRNQDREYDFNGNWEKTLNRDKWICRFCNKDLKRSRPIVHHKDGVGHSHRGKKANNTPDNLISLCVSCHSKLHHLINRVNRLDEDVIEQALDKFTYKGVSGKYKLMWTKETRIEIAKALRKRLE